MVSDCKHVTLLLRVYAFGFPPRRCSFLIHLHNAFFDHPAVEVWDECEGLRPIGHNTVQHLPRW